MMCALVPCLMSMTKVEFFRLFLETTPAIREIAGTALSEYKAGFEAQTGVQNPQEASEYAERCLEQLKVDEHLVHLFNTVTEFMSPTHLGDGLAEDMPLVEEVAELALRLSSKTKLSPSALPLIAGAIEHELVQNEKKNFLTRFLQQNAGKAQEYRIKQIEKGAKRNRNTEPDGETSTGYTLTQQALALHFFLTEGMNVTGVDKTKIIALAHLFAAKPIPVKNGKEVIGNSGIKTAFAKIREKQDKGQLADLRFVLRFFKPFEDTPSDGMKRIIAAIEREIAKTEERLKREEW